ncbi:MAG: sensor histidine kinase [Candidatus Sulfomarinibacteraceae bacterium]
MAHLETSPSHSRSHNPEIVDRALAEQRRALGRELHDNLGQQLTGLGFLAKSVRASLADADPEIRPAVDHLVDGLKKALADVRSLSHGLVEDEPAAGDKLAAILEEIAERTRIESSANCRFRRQGNVEINDPKTVRNLIRIAQEAIQNALRHARADSVEVALRRDGDEIRMEIRDDGRGLPSKRVNVGVGLKNMWKRAREIGAELDVRSKENTGTVVACTLNGGVA